MSVLQPGLSLIKDSHEVQGPSGGIKLRRVLAERIAHRGRAGFETGGPMAALAMASPCLADRRRASPQLRHGNFARFGALSASGTQAGLARFDGMRFTQFPALNDVWIYSLLQASDGALWVGTYQHGLYRVYKGHMNNGAQTRVFSRLPFTRLLKTRRGAYGSHPNPDCTALTTIG